MRVLSDRTFKGIAELMYSAVGLSFTDAKKPLVASRLAPRIQLLGLGGYEDYLALIEDMDGEGEFQSAIDLLTTNETYFFREPEHFAVLERELTRRAVKDPKVWSAASSYGDEAYSIAMLLADLQRMGRIGAGWSVLGTDISDRVLRSASEAVYPEDRLRHVTPERMKRYCLRGEGGFEGLVQMQSCLTERVSFGQLNLCEPVDPPGPFDAIFLRNVLIYFDAQTKRAVIDRVLEHLRPGGMFFIGTAEGRASSSSPLEILAPGAFRKPAE